MYYREDIINGVLCYKHSPNGKWFEISKEALSKRVIEAEKELRVLKEYIEIIDKIS